MPAILPAPSASTNNAPVPALIMGKPVIMADSRILNLDSGFKHKFLCTGPTFTAGTACGYRCTYCFVEAQVGAKPFVTNVLNGQQFQHIVIRRNKPVAKLRSELYTAKGVPKYKNAIGVIYGSPLVDIAADTTLAQETIEIVQLILTATGWDIRLLSKSPLIVDIAKSLSKEQRERVIFGLSTGTLDDKLARAIEPTCPSPSTRTKALRWLQDNGFRTFAMLCPILPQPMDQFIEKVITDIRPDKCEHVWAEVINLRGDSMTATIDGLVKAGLTKAAADLQAVCGQNSKPSWEQYAQDTFTALANVIPHNASEPKLRFLQYVTPASDVWWQGQTPNGAVVLKPTAKKPKKAAVPAVQSALVPTAPTVTTVIATTTALIPALKPKDPKRVAAAHKAWDTMRAKRAVAAAAVTTP
jgi:DNA repair photolyase